MPSITSAPLCTSQRWRTHDIFSPLMMSVAASVSGTMSELTPKRSKSSATPGSVSSTSSILATVFFAPRALAIMQMLRFRCWSAVTAINKSASPAFASLSVFTLLGDACNIIRSASASILPSRSSSSSMSVMFSWLCDSSVAR